MCEARPSATTENFGSMLVWLTPHPSPLPVEGRGGAMEVSRTSDTPHRVRSAQVREPGEPTDATTRYRPTIRARGATPSPLNGERAGVRGETIKDKDVTKPT